MAVYPWYDPNDEGLCVWGAWQAERVLSFAESLIDRSGNGNDLPVGVAPDWNKADGWDFDGALGHYLRTTFVPAADQSQTIIIKFSNCTIDDSGILAGLDDGANKAFYLMPRYIAPFNFHVYGNGGLHFEAGRITFSIWGMVGGTDGYLGSGGGPIGHEALACAAWAGPTALTVDIGRCNGTLDRYLTGYMQAIVIYDCLLTGAQIVPVINEMENLPQQPRSRGGKPRAAPERKPRPGAGIWTLPDTRDAGQRGPDARDASLILPEVQAATLQQPDSRSAGLALPDSRAADLMLPEMGTAALLVPEMEDAGLRVPEPEAAARLVADLEAADLLVPDLREAKEL